MAPSKLFQTASQTAGPYVHIGCLPRAAGLVHGPQELPFDPMQGGEVISIEGRVLDGQGAPALDAVVEIWQADAQGQFDKTGFQGFARSGADAQTGVFRFDTIKPGPVAWHDGRLQAPHLSLWIVARGINQGLHTRLYFADEAARNAKDPLLELVDQARRGSLVAEGERGAYCFDIRLQGPGETVFLDV